MSSKFEQFCRTIAHLRGPDGCPWDREQTYKTLTRYLLEETYEVLEAINASDFKKLKEELGDLLLQVVLQAQLGSEEGHFNIEDVVEAINAKMIARHPHVFLDKSVKTSSEVLAQWEQLKEAEKEGKGLHDNDTNKKRSTLENIPQGLPALLKALKISEKAVNQGFEWEKENDIWRQLDSEIAEFKDEIEHWEQRKKIGTTEADGHESAEDKEKLYLEMGDILFTMVNIARWHKIDPEEALLLTIEKFKKRFESMERNASANLRDLSIAQWEDLWKQAKKEIGNTD